MDIKVFHKDNNTPYEEIVELIHESFKERIDAGLNFGCATYNADEYKAHTKDGHILVAYNEGKVVGTVTLTAYSKFGIRYGQYEYLAVSSAVKRMGIGRELAKELKCLSKQLKLAFALSDTAQEATSSIKFHISQGFKVIGNRHYEGRAYDSVFFILPINILGKILCCYPIRVMLSLVTK